MEELSRAEHEARDVGSKAETAESVSRGLLGSTGKVAGGQKTWEDPSGHKRVMAWWEITAPSKVLGTQGAAGGAERERSRCISLGRGFVWTTGQL